MEVGEGLKKYPLVSYSSPLEGAVNAFMIAIKDNYQLLIEKLDQFIRKFYMNQLIKGGLFALALILGLFIALNVLEYNYYFSTSVRKTMFYSFLGVSAASLWGWVAMPLMHFYRLGKVISHEQAAKIIGDHFADVKDKLLNILQLRQQATNSAQAELIMASVNQKSNDIKFVPFKAAIDLTKNKKYLRYALPPLLLLLLLLWGAPSIIREGSKRLIDNGTAYQRPAPFQFVVNKDSLTTVQFSDYTLDVKVEGAALPNEMFIDVDNFQYRLTKDASDHFTYKFSNVQKEMDFHLLAGGFKSDDYTLNVLKKPNILGFDVALDYPSYTGRTDEDLSNVGDLVVPVGTNIDWIFKAQNTDNLRFRFSGKGSVDAKSSWGNNFTYRKVASSDETYKVFISNNFISNADSVGYTITVVPDLYPTINVERFIDSTNVKMLFFAGDASDDYGLRGLTFNYRMKRSDGTQGDLVSIPIPKAEGKSAQYQHRFDLSTMQLKPGEELTYYFEVFDNDAINGNKSSKTNIMTYAMPTVEQFEQMQKKNNEEIKDDLQKAFKETKKVQEDLKKLREKMLQQKDINWQDKKQLENMLNRQKELEKQIDDAKKNFQENMKNQEEFNKPNEELKQKQEQLEKLFNELQNPELKKLMEEMEKLMQQLEKDQALDKMEQMQMNNEELNMELDRMMELFKKLEVEQKMEEQINKLEELAKKQEDLAKQTENKEKSQDDLKKEQDKLNKEMDKLQKDQKEMEKKNEELKRPKEMEDVDKDMKETKEDMKESEQDIQDGDNKKAGKKQKKAAGKMKDMANKMKMKKKGKQMEEAEEDMAMLRQLLENLVGLSFDQEGLMKNINAIPINTPKYVESVQKQYKLKDDFSVIEDSLVALSKRNMKIESFVTEKIAEVKQNMRKGLEELEERQTYQAAEHQQTTMRAVNDLALMLAETLQQMQQQAGSMMAGDQECNKPGGKKGKAGNTPSDKMSPGQKEVKDGLEQMKKGMKDGKGGDAQQFAKMAAKQAAVRNALRQLDQEKRSKGQGGSKEVQQIIEEMNKVETDLVNKKLSNETLQRQEEIMTRLLEAERAEREREYDPKRKAEQAKGVEPASPPSLQEYLKKRESEVELYRTVSPTLTPYYKGLVEQYFKALKKG